jgi:hypothetical protein
VAASAPLQPLAPTTAINNIYVKISWVAPDNGSAAISAYKVFVADSTGTFSQEVTYCNGAVDPVLSQLYCEVPMTAVLRAAPYSLAFDSYVLAKVQASNVYGDGLVSDANTSGAKIQREPLQVQSLTRLATTNEARLDFQWTALSTNEEIGGSPILSYNVQWDKGVSTLTTA